VSVSGREVECWGEAVSGGSEGRWRLWLGKEKKRVERARLEAL